MPLAPTVRTKLATAGFRTAADLEGIGPADLARGSSAPAQCNQNTWFMQCSIPWFGSITSWTRCCSIFQCQYGRAAEAELSHEDALTALRAAGVGVQNGGLAGALTAHWHSAHSGRAKNQTSRCGATHRLVSSAVSRHNCSCCASAGRALAPVVYRLQTWSHLCRLTDCGGAPRARVSGQANTDLLQRPGRCPRRRRGDRAADRVLCGPAAAEDRVSLS